MIIIERSPEILEMDRVQQKANDILDLIKTADSRILLHKSNIDTYLKFDRYDQAEKAKARYQSTFNARTRLLLTYTNVLVDLAKLAKKMNDIHMTEILTITKNQ
jgi:predicted Zn-dependent protease